MSAAGRPTVIWVNVTTSVGWTRPPVGIVRVEQTLARLLPERLGAHRCRTCVWRSGGFEEWTATDDSAAIAPRGVEDPPYPLPGDILLTVGLDWDHEYSRLFHTLTRIHGLRLVCCAYDMIPMLYPQYCVAEVARIFCDYLVDLCMSAEAVLCISDQTRRDFARVCAQLGAPLPRTVLITLGDRLPVAGTDVSPDVSEITRTPFILYVSTIERRKNHEVLYRAYHLIAKHGRIEEMPTLVFVGMAGWGVADLLRDIEVDPLTFGKIRVLNDVSDAELALLYREARYCVFPSLYEGWGLPVSEALGMGKAVIASTEGAMREIGGDLVRYVAAWDIRAWAEALYEYATDPQLVASVESRVRSTYVPRRWDETAGVIATLLDELAANPRSLHEVREFVPGYDMYTQCGLPWGAGVRTDSAAGFLLYGPYVTLPAGAYRLKLVGTTLAGHAGRFSVEVTSEYASIRHYCDDLELAVVQEGVLADCRFSLAGTARNVEVRCLVDAACALHVDLVRITAVDPGQVNSGRVEP
jgi:glycosyltransferase involved in cell wall biosynthesis